MKDASVIPTGSAARGTIGSASLEALPVGIYLCDAEGRITRFNRRVAEVWGRTPLPGETERSFCGALFAPDGSPLPQGWTPAADVLRTRQPTRDLQIVIERPDGSRVHALANLDPLFGENGDFAGAVGCFQDISAVTRTREELQSSRDDLDDFFENAAIGLHVVANDGIILRANKAELDLLGYARSEYIGRHIAEFHADQAVIEDILQRLQRGEALDRYPARLKAKDGSIRHVLITSNGRFEGNSFAHTRCFTQDVTQEKLAEEQLREGEQRFRNVLEGMPMAIFTTDAEGFITFYNRVASQLAGREPRIGVDRYSIMPKIFTAEGEPLPPERTPIALTLKEKRAIRGIELIGERADGSRIHYMPHPAPLFDACGRLAGGVNVLEDVTESHKAKTELAHLAGIVASSNDAIISKTLEGIIRSWNAGAERIFGYSAEEIVGKPIATIVPPELHGEEEEILSRLQRGERIEHFETERVRKDGRRISVSLTVSPIFDMQGRIVGASKVARDITERRRAEQLQRLLISELNHRVKNTLATVQSIANQTVRLASDPSEFAASFSGRIRALARTHDILTRNSWQGADVMQLLRDQLLLNDGDDDRIALSGPSLSLDPPPALHLALVLHELGTNARKYGSLSVPEGRLSVSWEVMSTGANSFLLLWQETGGPLVQVPSKRGFGTKLIEKSLAAHGGEASIHYRGEGVSCEIRLPLPDSAETADRFVRSLQATTSPGSLHQRESVPGLDGKRVLVIEDEMLIAMDIASMLSEAGCQVVGPAATMEKAHALIAEGGFDVALLDANLAGQRVDGLAAELTRRGIPFAFVTGYEREGLPAAFGQAPMINKPFTRDDALGIVARLTETGGTVIPIRQKDA